MLKVGFIATTLIVGGLSAKSTTSDEFLSWSEKECEKILKRHTERLDVDDTHWGTLIVGGIGKAMESERNFFVWLSEPAAQAYARLIQIKAYLNDDEALEVLARIRPSDTKHFSIVMFTRSVDLSTVFPTGIGVDEGDKPGELGTADDNLERNLFLVDDKDRSRAVRIVGIEPLPDEIIVPAASRYDTAYGALLRFARDAQDGEPLVTDLQSKVRISFFRLGKKREKEFKIKDFRLVSIDQL